MSYNLFDWEGMCEDLRKWMCENVREKSKESENVLIEVRVNVRGKY